MKERCSLSQNSLEAVGKHRARDCIQMELGDSIQSIHQFISFSNYSLIVVISRPVLNKEPGTIGKQC